MQIQLRLLANLRKYSPAPDTGEETCSMEVRRGATVGEVLTELGVPSDIPKVVLLNFCAARPDQVLKSGDNLLLFPPVPGG